MQRYEKIKKTQCMQGAKCCISLQSHFSYKQQYYNSKLVLALFLVNLYRFSFVIDLEKSCKINSENFLSKGKSTPFENWNAFGKIEKTFVNGELVFKS